MNDTAQASSEPKRDPHELYARYKEIMGVCAAKSCTEDRVRGEFYCPRHVLADAF